MKVNYHKTDSVTKNFYIFNIYTELSSHEANRLQTKTFLKTVFVKTSPSNNGRLHISAQTFYWKYLGKMEKYKRYFWSYDKLKEGQDFR